MSFLSDNVIPDNHGKIFGTNAMEPEEMDKIKASILTLEGIKDVALNTEIFPREFTVHTNKVVQVADIEDKVKKAGFHAIPKGIFPL